MLVRLGEVLGFFSDLCQKLSDELPGLARQLVDLLLRYRREARENKDWALSDRIRDDLDYLGIELRDTPGGCEWKIKD